jgi:predicted GNAT superfamily acetyltransferase
MVEIEIKNHPNGKNMYEFSELMATALGINDEKKLIPEHMFAALFHTNCAFAAYVDGELVGFVCNWPDAGREAALYSHALCVKPEYRNEGVGESLISRQFSWAKKKAYEVVHATYDPLLSNNARLHVGKLGGKVRKYERNFYGELGMDEVEGNTPTDRFVVEKFLAEEENIQTPSTDEIRTVLCVGNDGTTIDTDSSDVSVDVEGNWEFNYDSEDTYVGVEIPSALSDMNESEWRYATREVFESLLVGNCGSYMVCDFLSRRIEDVRQNMYVLVQVDENKV